LSRALIFDSVFDPYKGVVSYIKIISGQFQKDKPVHLIYSETDLQPTEVGHFSPQHIIDKKLTEGQIGYLVT
jgi:GTP-binding protein LepA